MCIPKDGIATTHTVNSNAQSPLVGERNGAGCVDNQGSDSITIGYWYQYHEGINAAGPYNFTNANTRTFTMTTYHGNSITASNTHPFNYNENWTEFATFAQNSFSSTTTWPVETDFYDDNSLNPLQASANTVVGGGDSVNAIKMFSNLSDFNHISTGGGASLKYLEGGQLPGVNIYNPLIL